MSFAPPFASELVGLALIAGVFSGCATPCCDAEKMVTTSTTTTETVTTFPACGEVACPPRGAPAVPVKLSAVGYGAPGNYAQYTPGQQKLMAMRAAQVDAYRNLAEQVYGFRILGNTAVSAFATQNDNARSYVDAFIRGARVVNTATVADGNVETTVEIELSPQFLDALRRQGGNAARSSAPAACQAPGCSVSSANYISN